MALHNRPSLRELLFGIGRLVSSDMALAHEWLDVRAGSEKCFEQLAAAFPEADLYALSNDLGSGFDSGGRPVRTTFVPRLPVIRARRPLALPLMPLAWRWSTRQRYDKVLTSSHACVKGFRPGREAEHYSYCYTPMRYVWDSHDVRNSLHRLASFGPVPAMRAWDRRSVKWVDHFAAISTAVQERIGRYYEREACVIHPPVDTSFYTPVHSDDVSEEPSGLPGGPFVLTCSRFIPYKRLDLAIRAADRVGLPIVVAGHGPGEAALRHVAEQVRVPVIFEVSPSNERLRTLYRMASTFAFPALEDFGIVAVEAQACGTPVVGIAAGGSLDTIADGVSGVLAANQDEVALADALSRSLSLDPQACVDHASNFSHSEFGRRIQAWVTGNDSTDAGRTVDHLEAECPSL